MTDVAIIETGAHDPFPALLASLQLEFEGATDAHMARAIMASEELDFLWDARVATRRIGLVERLEDDAVAVQVWQLIGCLDGRWFVAKVVADGEGRACDLLEVRRFADAWDAYGTFGQ